MASPGRDPRIQTLHPTQASGIRNNDANLRLSRLETPTKGVGKHYIAPVSRPTGPIDPVGRYYVGPVDHEPGS